MEIKDSSFLPKFHRITITEDENYIYVMPVLQEYKVRVMQPTDEELNTDLYYTLEKCRQEVDRLQKERSDLLAVITGNQVNALLQIIKNGREEE